MAVTLEQAKVGMQNKVVQSVIDNFRRESFLLDKLTFDDTVSPGTGGSTLIYGYTQLKTPATADFRTINSEYTANEAEKEEKTAKLKVFGGAFQVDRVIQQTSGQASEVSFQMEQKIKAAANLFHFSAINGNSATGNGFDGLDKLLTGTSTEINKNNVIDLTTIDDKVKAFAFLEALDDFLGELSSKPTMLMGNNKLISKIKTAARFAGYMTTSEDAFGRTVHGYDGIPLVDLGMYYKKGTGAQPVVAISSRDVGGSKTGLTDLYAVSLGLDGFHGVTPYGIGGGSGIHAYAPDFNNPGAVKTGEVEMVAAVVLRNTRSAGVLRNLKVV